MTNLTLSFRLEYETVGGRTYQERLEALETTIRSVASTWWAQTTSFYAITTAHAIDDVTRKCKAAIAASRDVLVVLDADNKIGRIAGKNDDADIFRIIPYVVPV